MDYIERGRPRAARKATSICKQAHRLEDTETCLFSWDVAPESCYFHCHRPLSYASLCAVGGLYSANHVKHMLVWIASLTQGAADKQKPGSLSSSPLALSSLLSSVLFPPRCSLFKSDDGSGLRDHNPPIPVTVCTFETRRPSAGPKVTTVLRFATTTPRIPVTVRTFRRPNASPKATTVLRFTTTTPAIPVTVSTFGRLNVKSDDSSAFRHDFRLTRMRDTRERLRTLADIHATTFGPLLDPWTPTLKWEPFCGACGKNRSFLGYAMLSILFGSITSNTSI